MVLQRLVLGLVLPSQVALGHRMTSDAAEVSYDGETHDDELAEASFVEENATVGEADAYYPSKIWRCESVPAYKKGFCGGQKAACFSNKKGSTWGCLGSGRDLGKWACSTSKAPDGVAYVGTCVFEGHAKWQKAVLFQKATSNGEERRRRSYFQQTLADYFPSITESKAQKPAPVAAEARRRRTELKAQKPAQPPRRRVVPIPRLTLSDKRTTFWKGHGPLLGRKTWCKAQKPHPEWIPSHCSSGPKLDIHVLTYNLFWWNLYGVRKGNGASASKLIAASGPYDFIGFQECDSVKRIVRETPGMAERYAYAKGGHAVSMAYLKEKWHIVTQGKSDVNEDQWGRRIIHWTRLKHNQTGKVVFFVNHHGPLGDAGQCGHESTAYLILKEIGLHAFRDDSVVLVGDFNAVAHSKTVKYLEQHMKRIFTGKDFGGVDHVFTSCGEMLEKKNLGKAGSDHDALSVRLRI